MKRLGLPTVFKINSIPGMSMGPIWSNSIAEDDDVGMKLRSRTFGQEDVCHLSQSTYVIMSYVWDVIPSYLELLYVQTREY